MPETAISGTYPHPGIPGAFVTAGKPHLIPWLNRYAGPRLACDIETFGLGLDSRRIKCVVFAVPEHVLILDPRDPFQAHLVRQVLDRTEALIFHNAPFDVLSLTHNRLMLPQAVNKVVDTVVYARLAEPGETTPKTLEACTHRELGISSGKMLDTFKVLGLSKTEGYRVMDLDSPAYLYGAAADGIVTARLEEPLRRSAVNRLTLNHPYADLQPQSPGWAHEQVEKAQRKNRIELRRTVTGLRVDLEFLENYRRVNGAERAAGEQSLRAVGIDPGNGGHLTKHLTEAGALPPDHPLTKTGKASTKAADLELLAHPIAKVFVRTKQLAKVEDDYLQKVVDLATPDDHGDLRIHPVVNTLTAAHGRDSMGDPPLHQFPGPARGIVLAERGDEFGSVDWAQQEPVIGMNLGGDEDALYDYEVREKKVYDFVSQVAGIAYKTSKVVLLAGMYGEGLRKLSADLGLDPGPFVNRQNRDTGEWERVATYAAARELQARIFGDPRNDFAGGAIPGTGRLIKRLKDQSKQHGSVVTINGRVLPIPFGTWEGVRSRQNHKAPNFEICGSAYDQMTDAVLEMESQGLISAYYFGMHDENLVSKDVMHDVRKIMETPPEGLIRMARRKPRIRTDMAVLGERWSDA